MLSNIKIAIRNLLRRGYYTVINVLGLTIGISSFLLILVYVWDEVNYDRQHNRAGDIYRVVNVYNEGDVGEESSGSPFHLAPELKEDYPGFIQSYVRIFNFQREKHMLQIDSVMHEESLVYFADTSYFNVFNHKFLEGTPRESFKDKNSIVLTQSKAKELFGHEKAMGKTIVYQQRLSLTVTGIIEDVPRQSHFIFDALISFPSLETFYGENYSKTDWIWNPCWTYLLLEENVSAPALENKLPMFVRNHFTAENKDIITLYLQPLTDIHLKSNLDYEIAENSNYRNVVTLFFIAIILLLAAIINYINLTTASSVQRLKEISIKKINGASNYNVLVQFLIESTLMSLTALIISLAIAEWILPHYSLFTGKEFSGLNISGGMIGFIVGVGIFTGLLAGIYPAIQLTGLKPMAILRQQNVTPHHRALPRKFLVTFQIIISLTLLILSLGLVRQYSFLTTVDLGFNFENTIIINTDNSAFAYEFDQVKDSLTKADGVLGVTGFNYVPGVEHNLHPYIPEGKDQEKFRFFPAIYVRSGFFETYNIRFLAGRPYGDINKDGIVINKAMVDYLNWGTPEDALGKTFTFENWERQVIGVTENFNVTSLHDTIVPFVVDMHADKKYLTYFTRFLAVKYQPEKEKEVIAQLESLWKDMHPERPFSYDYHHEILKKLYTSERMLTSLILIFTMISILIATMGMLGLTSYITIQRNREVGIRKVIGAQSIDVVKQMLKEYLPLTLIGIVISWPLVLITLNLMMKDMAYRVPVGLGMFLLPTLLGFLVMMGTITIQSLKAANKNPIITLRDE